MGAIVMIVLVAILVLVITRDTRGRGVADVFAGLFPGSWSLGWPRGVQEEDTLAHWGDPPRRSMREDETPTLEEMPVIEDLDRPRSTG